MLKTPLTVAPHKLDFIIGLPAWIVPLRHTQSAFMRSSISAKFCRLAEKAGRGSAEQARLSDRAQQGLEKGTEAAPKHLQAAH